MPEHAPTPEQVTIIEALGEQCVVACPGAGKTRVIADRFARLAASLPPRRGVAVLSFTNAATDEIRDRCSRRLGRKPAFPHFVGTFDAFINRYFVLPFGIEGVTGRPEVLDSYSRLHIAVRPPKVAAAAGLSLDELVVGDDGKFALALDRVDIKIRNLVGKNKASWLKAALWRREGLVRAGLVTCDDARRAAVARTRDTAFTTIHGAALAARFAEVIVDEAQDCSEAEIEILEWLSACGIRLCIVADPDQAIFEFRDASPEHLLSTFAALPKNPLTTNFRSTPNICKAAATTAAARPVATAAGEYAAENLPVFLYAAKDIGLLVPAFVAKADQLKISRDDRVVIAHARTDVEALVHSHTVGHLNGGRAAKLARAVRAFQSTSDARERQMAIEACEHLILSLRGADDEEVSVRYRAAKAGVDARWLRRVAVALLSESPLPSLGMKPTKWRDAVLPKLAAVVGQPLSSKDLLPVKEATWADVSATSPTSEVHGHTIHQAKGGEYDAVLVGLFEGARTRELLQAWKNGDVTEPLRVIYVALTRARRLLCVGADPDTATALAPLLASRGAEVIVHALQAVNSIGAIVSARIVPP